MVGLRRMAVALFRVLDDRVVTGTGVHGRSGSGCQRRLGTDRTAAHMLGAVTRGDIVLCARVSDQTASQESKQSLHCHGAQHIHTYAVHVHSNRLASWNNNNETS